MCGNKFNTYPETKDCNHPKLTTNVRSQACVFIWSIRWSTLRINMTDTTNWIIHPIFQSQRGNKSAQITFKDKTPIKFFVNETSTPFNPSSWTPGDKRITLDLQVTPESEEFCKAVDKFVLDTVSQNPGNYFKKNRTDHNRRTVYYSYKCKF